MLRDKKSDLIRILNDESTWLAIALAAPSYLITLIGTEPILQGFFYLTYLIGLYFLNTNNNLKYFSKNFIIFCLLFFLSWFVPNIITFFSGRIESEFLSLPTLFYHIFIFFILIFWFRSWNLSQNDIIHRQNNFQNTLFVLISPLIILILIEAINLKLKFPNIRPDPFNYRHLTGEIILIFFLASLRLNSRALKLVAFLISLFILNIIENRSGLLAIFIGSILFFANKFIMKYEIKRFLILLASIILFTVFLYDYFLIILDYFFLIDSKARGLYSGMSQRLPIWIDAWNEFLRVPWTGVGFWVSPFPFVNGNLPEFNVHNSYLRILVENGAVLFIVILFTLIFTAFQIEKKQLLWHRCAFYSILIYYIFIPRHITLNPLSVLLYFVIIQSIFSRINHNIESKKNK